MFRYRNGFMSVLSFPLLLGCVVVTCCMLGCGNGDDTIVSPSSDSEELVPRLVLGPSRGTPSIATIHHPTDAFLESLNLPESIDSIELMNSDQLSDKGIVSLARYQGVRRITILACPEVQGDFFGALGSLPELEYVRVNSCINVDDRALRPLAACPKLKSIDVRRCPLVRDSVIELVKECGSLRNILLDETSVTDEGMRAINAVISAR